jgi:dimethylglycine dehydrogenase
MRWLHAQLPAHGVSITNVTDELGGFAVSGPSSRAVLARLGVDEEIPFLAIRRLALPSVGGEAEIGRIGLSGEHGYEVVVPRDRHLALHDALLEAGTPLGLRRYGDMAFDALRLEKGYCTWATEYRHDVTPVECGLDRYVAYEKGAFTGREAALAARETAPERRLVLLGVDAADADAGAWDPVRLDGRLVGAVTSGGYGHHVAMSLALAYVEPAAADAAADLTVEVMGEARRAWILPEPPYDPTGTRMRG